jgi:hypothetical protein
VTSNRKEGDVIVDIGDDYTTEWHCALPPLGVVYQVTSEQWTEDYAIRRIFAWEPMSGWEPRGERQQANGDNLHA